MSKNKKPFKNYIKDFKVENYFENTCGEIQNNSLVVKTELDEEDLSKINNSKIDIKNDCVIIIKKDKESMNKITLNDLYNFMKETNNKIYDELKTINKRLENVESFVEEQKVFNKKQELFNEKVNNFINKQEEFNNKQEEFNKQVIEKLDTHEKALKKAKLL